MTTADSTASGIGSLWRRAAPLLAAVVVFSAAVQLVGLFVPFFATGRNLAAIAAQAATVAVGAAGITIVIMTRGIDLSVGGIMSLVGIVEGMLFAAGFGVVPVIVVGLLVGVAFGCLSGLLVAALKVPSFIATFATLGIASGLALFLASGRALGPFAAGFVALGHAAVGPLPVIVLATILLCGGLELVMRASPFGVHVRAVGGAFEVAGVSGVPVRRTVFLAYVIAGALSAAAGTLLTAQLSAAGPLQGEPYTLLAIAACVVGGVDLFGGRGRVWGAVAGALLLAAMRNALNLLGVQPFIQDLVTGILIIAAVFVIAQYGLVRGSFRPLLRQIAAKRQVSA
jgi:ribose/xylose/arabinose/galactoside ABC-type transport system permease subunit